jgi:GT2 family glycosyltransferase
MSMRRGVKPTAVIDVDVEQLPEEIVGLERFSLASILIRFRTRPIGHTTVPVIGGRIDGTALREAVVNASWWSLLECQLRAYLQWDDERRRGFIRPKATVAVCTRDRPQDLRSCLEAIMRVPDDGQEILVVDNCPSSDATRGVVDNYHQVRYVREDRPGASAARNRALREARHEIVAFSDDDARPDPGWLRALLQNFDDPLVMCVTGLTIPLELETEAQQWFERHTPFGRGFKRYVLEGLRRNPLHVAPAGTSANMALRRDVQNDVGFFDEALGPGTPSKTGEDFDMFSRILTCGYRIVYDPTALSWHRHRSTWSELRQTVYGYGVGVYAYLTKSIVVRHEFGAPSIALGWLRYEQIPALIKSLLRGTNSKPLDLLFAEMRGCVVGPWAYLTARRQLRRRNGLG